MQPQGVSMKGQFVKVHLKSGSMYTGYLQDGADGIILEGSSRGEFVSSPPNNTVTIPADEIVKVVYEENDRWNRGQELNRTFDGLNLREVEPQTRDLRVTEERGLPLNKTYDMSPRRYEAENDMFEEFLKMDQLQDLQIARLDTNVDGSVPGDIPTHSYGPGPDSFHLNGLPDPHLGEVVGLVGQKGTGTTTVFKILAGNIMPNLGRLENPPEWEEIINHFHGEEIRSYLTRLQANKLIVATKEQDLTAFKNSYSGQRSFRCVFTERFDAERVKEIFHDLDLTEEVLDYRVSDISEADLQRIAIALTVLQNAANVYLFDEPTTFLDAKQKYQAVKVIRSVVRHDRIVIVADPDLSLLDMVADRICRITGASDKFGDVSLPMSFTELIDRYFPEVMTPPAYAYPNMCKDIGVFRLRVKEGRIMPSEITIVFGEKKTGKSTFLNVLRDMMLTGLHPIASHKLQKLPAHRGNETTVDQCLRKAILLFAIEDPVFKRLVMEPFGLNQIFDKKLSNLSPSEKQMMYIAITLGKHNADVFLLDEPSAHLDSDQRMTAAQVIKSFIVRSKKSAIIVEDDMMMATHMGDKLIALEGEAGVSCSAQSPMPLKTGLSSYLSELNITCKHDSHSLVPRINKGGSDEDAEQRARGIYFEDLGGPVKNLESK